MSYHLGVATMGPTRQRHSERWAGNLLRMARARRGWSQRRLAEAAGVPQSTIGRIESAAMQPTLPLLDRIVAAAGFDLRTRLEPYDDHDDILDATRASLTAPERLRHDTALRDRVAALESAAVTTTAR